MIVENRRPQKVEQEVNLEDLFSQMIAYFPSDSFIFEELNKPAAKTAVFARLNKKIDFAVKEQLKFHLKSFLWNSILEYLQDEMTNKLMEVCYPKYVQLMDEQGVPRERKMDRLRFKKRRRFLHGENRVPVQPMAAAWENTPLGNFLYIREQGIKKGEKVRRLKDGKIFTVRGISEECNLKFKELAGAGKNPMAFELFTGEEENVEQE